MGSFEAPVVVPELKQAPLKVSSVGVQHAAAGGAAESEHNPLIRNGEQLVPNLTHIVGKDQKMFFFYEVYDPASAAATPDVRTSLAFYRGKVKVFETPVVERRRSTTRRARRRCSSSRSPPPRCRRASTPARSTSSTRSPAKFAFPRLTLLHQVDERRPTRTFVTRSSRGGDHTGALPFRYTNASHRRSSVIMLSSPKLYARTSLRHWRCRATVTVTWGSSHATSVSRSRRYSCCASR